MFLYILITFLERCVDSGVLELFLSVFLIILKTFHEHNVFLTCSYICVHKNLYVPHSSDPLEESALLSLRTEFAKIKKVKKKYRRKSV